MKEKLLIALGGNALLQKGEKGTDQEQLKHMQDTCDQFLALIKEGYHLAITHGNGPQVGGILLQNEIAKDKIFSMPLDICGAQSQGLIGYMLQRTLYNTLIKTSYYHPIATVLTQVLVDKHDPAFKHPSKPIGPFYTKEEADKLKKEKKWEMVEQTGKGFRRVVPSPIPIDIIEKETIEELIENKNIVIACGGGGIPVILENDKTLTGIEAVIDKDQTAAVLAGVLQADILLILTDVEQVFLHFGKPNQQALDSMTLKEANLYQNRGEFQKGSMGPKVDAACRFVKEGGKKAIITSLEKAKDALAGKTGTVIHS